MMNAEKNQRITRIGPDTPAGDLLRRYWQPAGLVEELSGDRPVVKVRLLGENFVLFRDEQGRYGMLDRACPHRGADLAFGRLEDGGLRCPFHGWLFDMNGNCLEAPAEPDDRALCANIKQGSYPVVERSGILFAYLGSGTPPAFPELDCFVAPDTHTFAFKGYIDCNWLQGLEVGLDPAHASFLHRFAEDDDPSTSYGRPFRGTSDNSNLPITKVLRDYPRPNIKTEPTDYGFRIITRRQIDEDATHVRVTNLLFPNAFIIPMDEEMTISQWHVPILNGYKRYRPNLMAPDRANWGRDNRGVMARTLTSPEDPAAARIENRIGEPAANPYLYMASQVLSGLDGITRRLEPGPSADTPYETDTPLLPQSFAEAIELLRGDQFFRDELGTDFIDYYLHIKDAELARFQLEITEWEHREYLELF